MSEAANDRFFSTLVGELGTRSASALLGALGPVSSPLRAHLRERLDLPSGEEGSFLADPVFEAIFDWQPCGKTIADLSGEGLLHADLLGALASRPSTPEIEEYIFPKDRQPYTHQERSWRVLSESDPQSVVVTSGTGSGKTECFVIPVLDALARERESVGHLTGVRGLFLYPLNALINSQRDRLRAWCEPFGGDLRFSLYKGDTPETVPSRLRLEAGPHEVLDRKTLREDPPPVLVTNSTMLEYMLIRDQDQPILEQSKGMLRWVVLDEAHTYIGSAAAELSLLLRRVLHAFDVDPREVRFVATSATIGGGGEENRAKLRRFLADIGGIPEADVHVIEGARRVPDLPQTLSSQEQPLPPLDELAEMQPEDRFKVLASSVEARRIRRALATNGGQPRSLQELTDLRLGHGIKKKGKKRKKIKREKVEPVDDAVKRAATLRLLDLCTTAELGSEAFLRLRAHLFHRTHGGVWACVNRECAGREGTALQSEEWPFGAVYFERRENCPTCDGLVFEVVLCSECGEDFLASELVSEGGTHRYKAKSTVGDVSEAQEYAALLEDDDSDDESVGDAEPDRGVRRLLTSPDARRTDPIWIDPQNGLALEADEGKRALGELRAERGVEGIRCSRCGSLEKHDGQLFREMRRGGPFFLRSTTPILLDYMAPSGASSENLPLGGRKLISFTDSRQGTARFALDSQLDAERNYIRSFLYHTVVARRKDADARPGDLERLSTEVDALREAAKKQPTLQAIFAEKERELNAARSTSPGVISWREAARELARTNEAGKWMLAHWRNLPLAELPAEDVGHFCILREFARRPRRQNSIETLGLVAIRYPRLADVREVPAVWAQRSRDLDDWRDFLKVCVDFLVRSRTAVEVDSRFLNWMGSPIRPRVLVGPEADFVPEMVVRWPLASRSTRSRLVQLLARVLRVDAGEGEGVSAIDACLRQAWTQLSSLLVRGQDGMYMRLQEQAELVEGSQVFLCPVTRRLLDTTVCGITPYALEGLSDEQVQCDRLEMPRVPDAFWRRDDGSRFSREEVHEWLNTQPEIEELRRRGVWSDLSDRLSSSAGYFQVAEHSAQQSAERLKELEGEFKEGRVNLLSCSTTMEMGVDVGGLRAVAMNNAPPGPSNYLQRAGRAGRRGERRALAFTLCRSTPHGEAVFREPTWPFTTPIYVGSVTLSSERIVRRHLNSLALTRFLSAGLEGQGLLKFQAGPFFERATESAMSVAEQFETWLSGAAGQDPWLEEGFQKVTRRSALDGVPTERLLNVAAADVHRVRESWLAEKEPLERELSLLGESAEDDIPRRAISQRMARLREEYLLSELAVRNFIPGYGFPTNVVPFVTTTAEDLEREKRRARPEGTARIETRSRNKGYPTRDLSLALRDYAPGANVVLDGRVLESKGVTLNWKTPVSEKQVREIQALEWAWRCRSCGSAGVRRNYPDECATEGCGGDKLVVERYLRPSGFAVEIAGRATNDLTRNSYLPVEDPWITTGGATWKSLPLAEGGRYRYSADGSIFVHSRGIAGTGYALCLRCGRAAAEGPDTDELPPDLQKHRPLRGGRDRDSDGRCLGNENEWSVLRNILLGTSRETDVFELQLWDPKTSQAVRSEQTMASVAVALRSALTEHLGIEEREIGWATVSARVEETGAPARSLVLYDTASGGAGFVARASEDLPSLLRRAREILECERECDKACHGCLLAYDTQHSLDKLDRRAALETLTEKFLAGLELADELRIFGSRTRLEFANFQDALARELQNPATQRVRLYVGGEAKDWELELWPLLSMIRKWSAAGITVELGVSPTLLKQLSIETRNLLAAWIDSEFLEVFAVSGDTAPSPNSCLVAELGGDSQSTRYGLVSPVLPAPGSGWLDEIDAGRIVRCSDQAPLADLSDRVGSSDLRDEPRGTLANIDVRVLLDGRVQSFGQRFWKLVSSHAPRLEAKLATGGEISAITYCDRYLYSPLPVRLVLEVVRALVEAGAVTERTLIDIQTMHPERDRPRPPQWINDNWPARTNRALVVQGALSRLGARGQLTERARKDLPHARELSIKWADGANWRMRLDQGFGFMQARSIPFDFEAPHKLQAHRLVDERFDISGSGVTHLYVFDIDTPST